MNRIWTLAAKDLLQTRRDRMAALFTLILPVVFTMFFGFLLGGKTTDSLPVIVVDADTGSAGAQLVKLLEASTVLQLKTADRLGAERAVQDQKVAAAVLIPADFSAAMEATGTANLTLVGAEGSSGTQTALQAVGTAANRLVIAGRATRVAIDTAALTVPAGQEAALQQNAQALVDAQLNDPPLTVAPVDAGMTSGKEARGFDLSSPGMLINWILFSLLTAGTALVAERRSRALQRLLTTQVTRPQVILGKALAMMVITLLQQVILIGLGQFAFGVDYLNSPGALVLCMVTLSAVAATLGLLIATVFKSEPAVISTTVILSMVLAAMSGAWFPLEITGPTFSAIGHAMPTAWVLDSLRGIILQGFTLADVVPKLAVAWAYAAVFFALAVWRFRFE
jgi:ABC-2 type transport system permease protein